MDFDRITFDPQVLGGRACIRGMRIQVSVIVGQLANEATFEEVLASSWKTSSRHSDMLRGSRKSRFTSVRTAETCSSIELLGAVLADCSSVLDGGAVVVVEETRHRVRRLPVGHDQS